MRLRDYPVGQLSYQAGVNATGEVVKSATVMSHGHDYSSVYAPLTHDHEEFLTQAEIEALPGFGGGGAALPVGMIMIWAAVVYPPGWMLCDGALLSRTTYSLLYSVIGEVWGVGDGVTTFALPDYRGRVLMSSGQGTGLSSRVLAETGGAETVTLSIDTMPSHDHDIPSSYDYSGDYRIARGKTAYYNTSQKTLSRGGGQAHNNLPPYSVVNLIIYGGVL